MTEDESSGDQTTPSVQMTRRSFVGASVAVGSAAVAIPLLQACGTNEQDTSGTIGTVRMHINGEEREVAVDNRTSLLDMLRERAGLPGTKKGCDQGACGACTVLVNERRVLSCLTLAVMADGTEITTIEGLARDGSLHPLQQAFIDEDGFQ